jgi:regulatory protein
VGVHLGECDEPLTESKARQLALKWLTRREHSGAEVLNKLVRKGCRAADAQAVVAQLGAELLLSDDRFVEAFVAARRNRGYGPVRIRAELKQKGVADELVRRWLDTNSGEWLKVLERVRQKKFGRQLPKSFTEHAEQARFLAYRGFTTNQIRGVLRGAGPE